MSLFSMIREKLGFNGNDAAAAVTGSAVAPPSPASASTTLTADTSVALSTVDVVAKLEALAASNPQKLNWRVSIVDLMKLLGLDSSLTARKELAIELGCPVEKMADSAQMNLWLHKTIFQRLAENGGNIPEELL